MYEEGLRNRSCNCLSATAHTSVICTIAKQDWELRLELFATKIAYFFMPSKQMNSLCRKKKVDSKNYVENEMGDVEMVEMKIPDPSTFLFSL